LSGHAIEPLRAVQLHLHSMPRPEAGPLGTVPVSTKRSRMTLCSYWPSYLTHRPSPAGAARAAPPTGLSLVPRFAPSGFRVSTRRRRPRRAERSGVR
jgi:hypothetical protein